MSLIFKPIKKITQWQEDKLPDLFTTLDVSTESNPIFAVYDGKITKSKFVGAVQIYFVGVGKCTTNKIYLNIYIDKFEISKNKQKQGFGTRMFNDFITICPFPIYKISLSHIVKSIDGGCSYRFWKNNGFKRVKGTTLEMEKIINK